jgi:hypothetical protein
VEAHRVSTDQQVSNLSGVEFPKQFASRGDARQRPYHQWVKCRASTAERQPDGRCVGGNGARIKVGYEGTTVINAAPEFEDCRAVAEAAKVPLKQVLTAAMAAWQK